MSTRTIKKSIANYINTEVFINPINMPLYNKSENIPHDSKLIIERLDIIMRVRHQEFWCHIIYDLSILNSLHSFCSNATRPYEMSLQSKLWSKSDEEIRKKFYLLILRLMSNKENMIPEFSNENFGALIYDNFIVDIPLLFDICALYGEENPEVITKMLQFIFTCQPLYLNDLKLFTTETIKILDEKINYLINSNREKGLLAKTINQNADDILFYLLDVSYSWYVMLKSLKSNREITSILYDVSFHKSIETYFEKFIPYIQGKIDNFETTDPDQMKKQLSLLCFYLISIWKFIFDGKFLNQLKNSKNQMLSSEENFSTISDCLTVISGCQENPNFADAMYLLYPIDEDFQVIFDAVYQDKDEYYSGFVNESVMQVRADIESRHTIFSSLTHSNRVSSLGSSPNESRKISPNPEPVDMGVKQVREIFPDLTDREIQAYLRLYGCDADHMLDSLLAGAIDIPFVKAEVAKVDERVIAAKATAEMLNHRNIFDGDDLDTGRVTAAQLHIGKRQKAFNDHIDPALRSMILDIAVQQDQDEIDRQVETSILLGPANLNYDDEFDDVYGISHDGVLIDNKNADDLKIQDNVASNENKANKPPIRTNQSDQKPVPVGASNGDTDTVPIIMEPSKPKYSNYDKRQFKKQRFHDGPQKTQNGVVSHRVGHVQKEKDTTKRDHRPKAAKNNRFA